MSTSLISIFMPISITYYSLTLEINSPSTCWWLDDRLRATLEIDIIMGIGAKTQYITFFNLDFLLWSQ